MFFPDFCWDGKKRAPSEINVLFMFLLVTSMGLQGVTAEKMNAVGATFRPFWLGFTAWVIVKTLNPWRFLKGKRFRKMWGFRLRLRLQNLKKNSPKQRGIMIVFQPPYFSVAKNVRALGRK